MINIITYSRKMEDSGDFRDRCVRIRKRRCTPVGWIKKESWLLFKLFWPTVSALILEQLVFVISLFFVGHIKGKGALSLEATGLAVSIINISVYSIALGMTSAIDTVASQAYGAKNFKKVGIMLQRGICILGLAMLLVFALWVNIESFLNMLQQPPCVIQLSKQYIQIYMAAVPALYLFIVLQKYLQVQNIVLPFIATALTMNITSAILHYIFIYVANMGVRGAALAVVIAMYSSLFLLILIIIAFKLYKKTWFGWSRDCLNGWWEFVRYGVPGLVMICFEWWSFEIGYLVLGTAEDGPLQQGVHAILMSLITVAFIVPYSLGIAVTIRIGNELGAGNPKIAKQSLFVGFLYFGIWMIFIQTMFYSLRVYIPLVFTSDICILEHIGKVAIFLISPIMLFDHFQAFIGGALRGLGKQTYAAIINFFSYFVIGVPLGCVLALPVAMGAVGFWTGLCVAVAMQALLYCLILISINWKKESEKAQKTAGATATDISEESTNLKNDVEMIELLSDDIKEDDSDEHIAIETRFTSATNSIDSGVQDLLPNEVDQSEEDDDLLVPTSNSEIAESESEVNVKLIANGIDAKQSKKHKFVEKEVHLSKKIFFSRLIFAGIALLVLIIAIIVSQLLVYRPQVCLDITLNSTNATRSEVLC